MSDSSNGNNSEEVASDEEPSVFFRNSEIKTLSNIMVESGHKERRTAGNILATVKQHTDEGDEDESYGIEDNKLTSNHKFKVYQVNGAYNDQSENDSYQLSSESAENNDHFDIDGPVQLVKVSQDLSTFEVCEEGLKVLRSIKEEIGIVSLAGAQRTGKSFALNMLLDKLGGKGFKVSPSTASCTQGIWIWGKPTYVESRNMYVVLLDTEGSGSIDKNSTHDGKIFALVVLISSFFIYNSFGAIDENAINNLSLAAKLSTNIAVRAGKGISEDEIIANFTPKFLWLLRDFVLELKENGHKITENEYLESKLNNYTEVKTALVKFFRMRELITMVRPVDDEYRLANLNNVTYDKLRPQFRQKAEILKKKVFEECPLKQMNNKRINGKVLAKLLTMYVEAINEGAVPNITSAWESVVDGEREKYFHKAKSIYSQKVDNIPTPKEEAEFLNYLFELRQEALDTLNEGFKLSDESVDKNDQDIKIKELKMFIQKHENEAFKANLQASRKYCEDLVKNAFSSISVKLRNEGYTAENMEEMQFDVVSFTNMYNKQAVGPAKTEVFTEFINTAIPKISKDVLTKEYMKQKDCENRLNQAVKILQEKNKMLEDNIKEMEDDHGEKQDVMEELESKLRKATKQEQLLLEKAEQESKKRQELIDELNDQQVRNNDLEVKQQKAEKELKSRMHQIENEYKKQKDSEQSKEAISKNKEKKTSNNAGQPIELDDIEVGSKTDAGGKKANSKNNKKKINKVQKGEGSCKCEIF